MTLIERPYSICFSKNEIRYVFQLDNLIRPGLFLQLKLVYLEIGSTVEKELPGWDLKPDENGFVRIYLQKYLDSLIDYVLPSVANMFTNADGQAKQFYVKFREIEDAIPNPAWDESEANNKSYVIKGGIEKHKNSRNNFFVNYFDVQKPWLTWQPSGRFIFDNEQGYLSFLNQGIDATGLKLRVTAYDTTGINSSQWTFNLNISSGILFHIAIGITALNIATNLTGDLYYYEVQIVNASNVALISNYRFYKEYRPAYYFYDLVYHNSISGIDFIRVKGEVDETFERTFENGESSGFNLNDWTNEVKPYENAQTGLALQRTYKGDVGFLKTKKEQTSLVEITVSKSVYQKIFLRWTPVIILQKAAELGKLTDKTRSFPIEWALSEVNEVYTPAEIGFGDGTNDGPPPPDCIAASITGTLPNATVGQPYYQTLGLTGTAPIILTDFAGPAWMNTPQVVSGGVLFTGTPDETGTNIPVSFRLNNCDPVPFDFSDEIDVTEPSGNINWTYYKASTAGTFKIIIDGAVLVNVSSSGSGVVNAAVGASISVIVSTDVSGTAELDISGPYTVSYSDAHVVGDDFTIEAGTYNIDGRSL